MTRTLTKPLDDEQAWREVVAAFHPDRRQDKKNAHETFIWITAVREYVCGGQDRAQNETPPRDTRRHRNTADAAPERVPFSRGVSFDQLTSIALERAGTVSEVYGGLLLLLRDCVFMADMERQQCRGASYRQLAYIAHLAKMSKAERGGWYRVAEDVPLADRHASHLISRLQRSAAA